MTRELRIARIDDGEDVLQTIAERGLPTERERLLDVLDRHQWQWRNAAAYLGISVRRLQHMVQLAARDE